MSSPIAIPTSSSRLGRSRDNASSSLSASPSSADSEWKFVAFHKRSPRDQTGSYFAGSSSWRNNQAHPRSPSSSAREHRDHNIPTLNASARSYIPQQQRLNPPTVYSRTQILEALQMPASQSGSSLSMEQLSGLRGLADIISSTTRKASPKVKPTALPKINPLPSDQSFPKSKPTEPRRIRRTGRSKKSATVLLPPTDAELESRRKKHGHWGWHPQGVNAEDTWRHAASVAVSVA
ncbi:hypothetical protein C8Q75DRAFT_811967 [Abortiporus biennis]|nr:hypothetical protein C8Q75DRAFT_811967 [Abortiporus biennis]